jgi:hypothetical protein
MLLTVALWSVAAAQPLLDKPSLVTTDWLWIDWTARKMPKE